MARLWAVLSGGAAGLAAYRLLRRRRTAPPEAPAEPDARAEELRAKLAETREEPEPAAEEEPQDVAARRGDVHERARAAIEEMRGDGEAS
jgi:hypothetical protein